MPTETPTTPTPVVVNQNVDTDAIQGVLSSVPEIIKESKAGYKSTEFWVTVVTALLVVINAVPLPAKFEGAAVAALGIAYTLSRGLAKQGVPVVEVAPVTDDAPAA